MELGRNQHVLRRRQRRHGGDVDRRRRVDDDRVVAIFEGREPSRQAERIVDGAVHVEFVFGGQHIDVGHAALLHRRRQIDAAIAENLVDSRFRARGDDVQTQPGVALGIEVDDQHAAALGWPIRTPD